VKTQTIYSRSGTKIEEIVEIPSPPPSLPGEVLAVVQVRGEPPKRGAGPIPWDAPEPTLPWRNLTLDEFKNWAAHEQRRQGITQ
jgi:hypothetical protein